MPILINALTDKDNDIRHSIVWCLRNYPGRKGNHQAEIVAAFCRSLEDSDARVRKVAAITLAEDEVRTAEAYEAMKKAVKDSDKEVKTRAIGFMSKFPDRAAESVEVLVQAASDEDSKIRYSALSALTVTLHTPKSAPPTIVKLLADDDQNVRHMALDIFLRYESDQKKSRKHYSIVSTKKKTSASSKC